MSPPPAQNMIRALEILYSLGVLNDEGKLTDVGNIISEFPVDPYLAKMVTLFHFTAWSTYVITVD
jgi:HrpA-like RNA helicase